MQEGSHKAIVAALSANIGIALVKFVGFFFTGAEAFFDRGLFSVPFTAA